MPSSSCFQDREGEWCGGQLGQAWLPASPHKSVGWGECLSNFQTSWSCRLSVDCRRLWLGRGLELGFWEDQGLIAGQGLLAVTISPQGAPIPDHTPEPEPDTFLRGERVHVFCAAFLPSHPVCSGRIILA